MEFFSYFSIQNFGVRHILKNGTETTATVIDIGKSKPYWDWLPRLSIKPKKNEPSLLRRVYYILFSFVNSDGEEIRVKTYSMYLEIFLRKLGVIAYNASTHKFDTVVQGKAIQIMYTGNKAVAKGYATDSFASVVLFVYSS